MTDRRETAALIALLRRGDRLWHHYAQLVEAAGSALAVLDNLRAQQATAPLGLVPRRTTPLYLVYSGSALEGLLYRIVEKCPPCLRDFSSYEALGRTYNRRDFFRGTGLSVQISRERAIELARRFGLGSFIASLDLRIPDVVWTESGRTGHVTVWAPPELLLKRVLQCERYE